jgi:hypothetical protein
VVAVDGVVGMGGPPTHTATIALTRVTLMARPMAATTATAMLDLTGAATAGVVVGVVGDAIDGIPRGVAVFAMLVSLHSFRLLSHAHKRKQEIGG